MLRSLIESTLALDIQRAVADAAGALCRHRCGRLSKLGCTQSVPAVRRSFAGEQQQVRQIALRTMKTVDVQREGVGPQAPHVAGEFWGPEGQFKWYRIVYAIICAIWHSGHGTAVGLSHMLWHPHSFFGGLAYCVQHPAETVGGLRHRAQASLEKNGIVYTVVCAILMIVLPGGGMFGKVVDLSEYGNKAKAMSRQRDAAYKQAQE